MEMEAKMASVLPPLTASIPNFFPRKRERIAELAERCLRECVYFELRSTRCELRDGTLILCGKVSSFYLKQIAQTLIAKIPGVRCVDNQLEVVGDPEINRQFEIAVE